MENYKVISIGMGQCSSVLPFMKKWLFPLDYDEIIFANTGYELDLTYEHLKIMQKEFPITVLNTDFKHWNPPICTKESKILPIRRYLRSKGVKKCIMYLGYTIEEKKRVKKSDVKWVEIRYPLIERGFTRKDCQKYLLENLGYVPPRSGCITCRYFDREHLITRDKEKSILVIR